jgi:hypothetical protein
MSNPVRVQLSRAKGWRMPPNTVKVDRSTRWGNPFYVGPVPCECADGECPRPLKNGACGMAPRRPTAAEAVEAFREVMRARLYEQEDCVSDLRGKNLACWCPLDQPCHADVLLELANDCGRDALSYTTTPPLTRTTAGRFGTSE